MKFDQNFTPSSNHPFEISVISCHHKGNFIYKFVDSVKKSIGVKYEIIVITSDNELALKGIPGCKVMNGDQYPAAKRNQGARISSGKYLAFFDDDVEIEPDCLLKYKQFMDSNPSCGMAYGKLYNMEHRNRFDEAGGFLTSTGFIWSRAGQNDIDTGQYDYHATILAGKSASCIMREELFFKIGGFDEEFEILGEETLLSWRVWLYGERVCFVPESVGFHAFNCPTIKPPEKFYTNKRVFYNGPRNYISMLLMCLERRSLWILIPHYLIWFMSGVLMLLTLKVKQAGYIFLGILYPIRNLKKLLEKRRRIQEKRFVSDRELFKFIHKDPSIRYYIQRFLKYCRTGLHG